jgi:hypothetical protein
VRLQHGELLVHSPAPLTAALQAVLDELGPVRFVVPASALHGHLFMEQYRAAYPRAELFSTPGLARRRRDLSSAAELGDEPDARWTSELDQTLLHGHKLFPEVVFHHRPSATLLAGDFAWHVTPAMSAGARLWAGWRPGVRPTPAFRLALRDRAAARASLERILHWNFERIVPGHGEVVEHDGRAALAAGYAWLQPDREEPPWPATSPSS